jgi:hypothetical protein
MSDSDELTILLCFGLNYDCKMFCSKVRWRVGFYFDFRLYIHWHAESGSNLIIL